ncbi:MAG: winged helix-turn-helix domain-containing protein [Candidatus Jordarchaeum sp.]|uniref:winged helix-turn-helix domain-containing protein n=1 Tax=Candidatus Jordarchaeum sp. TaxID=2823881 RepID=UPI00404A5357
MSAEKTIEVLASKNRRALINLLFENKRLRFDSVILMLGFERDFSSKFRKRYLEPLTKVGFIRSENDYFVLTPLGFLAIDFFRDIDAIKLYGKLRYLLALETPKTTRQLMRFLGVSRRTCWSQLEKLRGMGLVQTVRIRYKLRDDTDLNLGELPGYLKKVIIMMGRKAVSPAEIALATGQRESSVYSRMSDLMRLGVVEYAGPEPPPKNIFHIYHKLTEKGSEVLQRIKSFENVLFCMLCITDYLSKNGRVDELEIWENCSKKIQNINSFETRRAINILRMADLIQGNKLEGYTLLQ